MQITSIELINNLTEELNRQQKIIQQLKNKEIEQLNWRPTPESWSVLECIEHLKRYNDFYLPEIKKAISSSKHESKEIFKSGFLGNYFANSMLPKKKLNKMKAFKGMNPIHSKIDRTILDTFFTQNKDLIELLSQAKEIDLAKTKTAISLSSSVKLRIGDTFRFVINHQTRHFAQLENVLNQYKV